MRVPFSRSERSLSRGQRLLAVDPPSAAEALRAAAEAAPRDPQAKLFFAIALADDGRFEDADAQLEAAVKLAPANAVLVAERGVLRLDAGRPAEAKEWFARAAAMAPANGLLPAWSLLARWDEGDDAAAAVLAGDCRDRATRFLARVLLRTERHFLAGTRPALARDAAPPPRRFGPSWMDRAWNGPRARAKAERLMARGRHDAAADVLLQAREDFEGEELLGGLLPRALEGAIPELTKEMQESAKEKREDERRDAVFRLADCLLHLERRSEAAARLAEWQASWSDAGSPAGETHYAFAVAIAGAETCARLADAPAALEWIARAKAIEPWRSEILRAEALARLASGDERAARRLLERHLSVSLYSTEDRLRELITGVKAYLAA